MENNKSTENVKKPKTFKRLIVISALLIVLAISFVGTTVAYLMAETPPLDNSFRPVYVNCEVVEDGAGGNVMIKNIGDISAYIRVTFIVNWVADDGSVYGQAPKLGVDYEVTLNNQSWYLGSDGFYYYVLSVAPDASTSPIIQTVTTLPTAPEGYKLSFHITATAIQSEPAYAVESAWSVTVMETGAIMPK